MSRKITRPWFFYGKFVLVRAFLAGGDQTPSCGKKTRICKAVRADRAASANFAGSRRAFFQLCWLQK